MPNARAKLIGGRGLEFELFNNRVIEGLLAKAPSSASTQATGTGATVVRVDLTPGILAIDGTVKEYIAVSGTNADFVVVNATSEIANGQSRVYDIVIYKSTGDDVVYWRVYKGAAATTGAQVAPTDAAIEATLAAGTKWFRLARVTANRTGDTTITQSQINIVRPLMIPSTVNRAQLNER